MARRTGSSTRTNTSKTITCINVTFCLRYRFAHLCTEALCLAFKRLHPKAMSSKPFMGMLLNYLGEYRPQLNHLVVGFYVRLIVALLQAQPNEKWDEVRVDY